MRLNITITATLRRDLLSRTLKSFRKKLFVDYNEHDLFINIDPIGPDSVSDIVSEVTEFHKNPILLTPEKPNFASAVKRLWLHAKSSNPLTFHLEDDWVMKERVSLEDVVSYCVNGNYDWVNFRVSAEKGYGSPSLGQAFAKTEFIKKVASSMNDTVCPETQLKDWDCFNSTYTNRVLIEDTGRAWRAAHNLERSGKKKSEFVTWEKGK